MHDAEDRIDAPKNWREYLRDSQEIWRVWCWINAEIITPDCRKRIYRMMVLLAIGTIAMLLQTWVVQYLVNGLVAHALNLVLWGFAGIVACMTVKILAHHFDAGNREWIIGLTMGSLDRRITELLFEKSMGQHRQESSSLTASNIDKGRGRIIEMQNLLLFEGMPALYLIILLYIGCWFLSPVVALMHTIILLIYGTWMLFLNQQVIECCAPLDTAFRWLNRYRLERWEKIERVKTCGKEAEELAYMDARWEENISQDRTFWLGYIASCTKRRAVTDIGLLLTMAYGAHLYWTNQCSLGLLFPLFGWSAALCDNLWRIGVVEQRLNWNLPSVRSLIAAVSIPPDVVSLPGAPALTTTGPPRVEFENIGHSYPTPSNGHTTNGELPIIRNVSFTIEPGEKVSIMGPSGVGKTTIMQLLLRYMDPTSGCIRINGQTLSTIDHASWMARVGYIPQQALVFDGTIKDNLLYGLSSTERARISDDQLWHVMHQLKIDFGERFTDGLNTAVDRMRLSGGQAQRLMIGAAILRKPSILIVDEATSSLDPTTEREVHDGLAHVLGADISALIVTHRLSTVRDLCTKFVVLRNTAQLTSGDSQIEAIGTSFEDLFPRSPTFRQLAADAHIAL